MQQRIRILLCRQRQRQNRRQSPPIRRLQKRIRKIQLLRRKRIRNRILEKRKKPSLKDAEKKETIAKKSENSDNKNSVEKSDKKESVKAEKETGKTESSSKPEQKPSQPESKPEQSPSKPQTKPESKPEQKPSKPQHTHTWEEVTHTINHEEVGHNEQYVIKEAWTETVTEDVYDPWECCNVCGADCTADPSGHAKQHALAGEGGVKCYNKVCKQKWLIRYNHLTEKRGSIMSQKLHT